MRPASSESSHPRDDRRTSAAAGRRLPRRTVADGVAGNRLEWVPRGSAAPARHPPPPPSAPSADPPQHPRPSPSRYRHRRPAPPPPTAPPDSGGGEEPAEGVPQLVQEIQERLARGTVECMICYDMVRRSAPIWSCGSCFSIFHLHCIRKWARSPTSADAPAPDSGGGSGWRCPGCQSVQSVPAKDLSYTCFCARRRDPPNDLYITPHSCGEPCGKPLDRSPPLVTAKEEMRACPHVCVLQCHPGPCPPCKAFAPRQSCPCGKQTIMRRCADQKTPLTCGQRCNRPLSCARHLCDKMCHTGECGPCQVVIAASCFCKKKIEAVLCGDMAVKGELDDTEGVFSCDAVCGRALSCGNHTCPEKCHPGTCGECNLLPQKITTCHCGKTRLQKERESCLDPIPTCSGVCGKVLPCGVHLCKETCHEGHCPPCLVLVEQKCRCGSSSRTVECSRVSEEKEEFLCLKPCGRKKSCGRHRCTERCCPLSTPYGRIEAGDGWDPHLCSMPCGKKLRCGQHACQLLCHTGHCPPCLETIFTDLTCACGLTSIPPPLPCGTPPPSCPLPCSVPQPCGHAASHTCHSGNCPPCTLPVVKECVGGHVLLRNIPCGSKDIRCNQLCGKTRQCGLHACARTCHPPPCDNPSSAIGGGSGIGAKASCGQLCGAPRGDCRHTCTAPCHPSSPCPDLRCEFTVTISCSCGRITAAVPCSAGGGSTSGFNTDSVFEASVVQKLPAPLQPLEANEKRIPLGQRKLCCDEECAKLERKRVLADAFDITPVNLDALHFGENSAASDLLSDLLRREPKWVFTVEERCKFLVLGKSKGGSATKLRSHVFCHMLKEKRDAVRHIAERWKLSVHAAGWEPKRFLVVHATPKSKPPARILGSKPGTPVSAAHLPAFDPLVDMDPRLVVAMLDLPRDADVSALVLRFGGECELVWMNDKNALAVFVDPMRAATALRRLDHGSAYQGAAVVLQNSGPTLNNAWGLGAKTGEAASKSSNSWKKALVAESDSWGGEEWPGRSDAAVSAWAGTEGPPIVVSNNRWNVLDSESAMNLTKPEPVESSSSGIKEETPEEVDDWEEACE
ncbi:NF-X1-type zinc finger protein NFXL1 [Ananas comosus]|uniref:NF-X1-type zinc finger protein NFXL1 n=1 Tax=Ananas comosus TaxID=4615 RepID=A0A6P5FAS9_ANACO|nr:NF-X1-type zinc finger protein NFXL1 [Ananas comosus]